MFDFGWSELMVVAVVAVVVVGPRELPRLMRTIGQYVGKAKSMASELQSQFNDMAHQSELDEIRKSVNDLKDDNPLKEFEDSLNAMSTQGEGFNSSLDNVTERESGSKETDDDPGLVEDYDGEDPLDTTGTETPVAEAGAGASEPDIGAEPEPEPADPVKPANSGK